jgi:hypothetical protein
MLNNLKAELVRKGVPTPAVAISNVLGCTEKTARSKLDGKSPVTVTEAMAIVRAFFQDDHFTIEYLFTQPQKMDTMREKGA